MTKRAESGTVLGAVSFGARFRRSANLERDRDATESIEGYLPTGRALDTIRRIARAAATDDAQRAFSVIGPYGSGKSSMALFLDALYGPAGDDRYGAAMRLLDVHDPDTAVTIKSGRDHLGANGSGFVPAVVVADREPITVTVWRALAEGVKRYGAGPTRIRKEVRTGIAASAAAAADPDQDTPNVAALRDALQQVTEKAPVLLVIDEFGKNLEEFASATRDGDLYLLQQLAEWTHGRDALPLVIVTIQHLAFDQYVTDATTAQRREWAKVQGRFEEVAFTDSPATTRALIRASVNHREDLGAVHGISSAATDAAATMRNIGLPDLADREKATASYPLHPTTLAVLPDLCARYGQNERTLFSFVASSEPTAVPSLIKDWELADGRWVRPHHVYDYFVESSTTFVAASTAASRWIEVETRIRDAHALSEAQQRVLKTVGTLNLVSTGGPLRASTMFARAACVDGQDGTATSSDVDDRLAELADAGLVVHRDFADEWRLWEGSDFDVSSAVEKARRRTERRRIADIVSEVRPLPPVVAARHSYQRRTVRAFSQQYTDGGTVTPHPADSEFDGTICVVLGATPEIDPGTHRSHKPVLLLTPHDDDLVGLRKAAIEVAAIRDVLGDEQLDRVARRELTERLYQAQNSLDAAAANLNSRATWGWPNPPSHAIKSDRDKVATALDAAIGTDGTEHLSAVLDAVYPAHNHVPVYNEVINRHELTSQGSRVLRLLLTALVEQADQSELALKPGSAEHSAYTGTVRTAGGHDDTNGLTDPTDKGWRAAYRTLTRTLDDAAGGRRVTAATLLDRLQAPPHGMRSGAATVVLIHFLFRNAGDIALFEHGTFQPSLTAPHTEKLVKNPHNFSFRYIDASSRNSHTGRLITAMSDALGLTTGRSTNRNIVPLASRLVRAVAVRQTGVQRHYIHKTARFQSAFDENVSEAVAADAAAIRDVLVAATDPIDLILNGVPTALGYEPVVPGSHDGPTDEDLADIGQRTATALDLINSAYPDLCAHITRQAVLHTATGDVATLRDAASYLIGEATTATLNRLSVNAAKTVAEPAYGAGIGQSVHPSGAPVNVWSDSDVASYDSTIRRVGPEFRRDLAMARTGGTDAKLVQVSNGNGPVQIAVISAAPEDVKLARSAIARAMSHPDGTMDPSDPKWRQAILAALCEYVADDDSDLRRARR